LAIGAACCTGVCCSTYLPYIPTLARCNAVCTRLMQCFRYSQQQQHRPCCCAVLFWNMEQRDSRTSHIAQVACCTIYHLLLTSPSSPIGVPSHHSAVHVYPHQWMPKMQRLLVLQHHVWKACMCGEATLAPHMHVCMAGTSHALAATPVGEIECTLCICCTPPACSHPGNSGRPPATTFVQPNGTESANRCRLRLLHKEALHVVHACTQWLRSV